MTEPALSARLAGTFSRTFAGTRLAALATAFADSAAAAAIARRHGDAAQWQQVLEDLPAVSASSCSANTGIVEAGSADDLPAAERERLRELLLTLSPWRKGPFRLFGIDIETEWRSDWKWDRLAGAIAPLHERLVLDVGCGSGYHCFRMQAAGARAVLGVDPYPLFHQQFLAVQKYLQLPGVLHLPMALEDLPAPVRVFDTVFSMGVLYHHRSPFEHLRQLQQWLRPGGELVLETLVIDGDADCTLVPEDRYARMRNVWFIPSCAAAEKWLRRSGFENIRIVDVNTTSTTEQRSTEWMPFESLAAALDPADANLTVEGYPAPKRAVILANAR